MSRQYLICDERNNGVERLAVSWNTAGRWPQLEIAIERRDGENWSRRFWVAIAANEVFRLSDGVAEACRLAKVVLC